MAGLVVRNLNELVRTFNHAPADVKREFRKELRSVGEPVRVTAERLATSSIRRIGPNWSKMRTGVTTKVVYVAPRQRGAKGRGSQSRRRPNLAPLLADRALGPALEANASRIESDFDRMVARLLEKWGNDGP